MIDDDDVAIDGDWGKILDASTPAAELPLIVQRLVAQSMAALVQQLAADPDYTPAQQAHILTIARPKIEQLTTTTIENAWARLQPKH